MAATDKGRLIDAPDATDEKLRKKWVGLVALIEAATSDNAQRRDLLTQAFGPGHYKFLAGDRTLVPRWAQQAAPYVPIEDDSYRTLGPNSANFRVDLVEKFGNRTGGRWRFMYADTTNERVAQILKTGRGNMVLYTSLEKKRDERNRSRYRNVKKPRPGEILELYETDTDDVPSLTVVVRVERINRNYIVVDQIG
jgi:hypothetical protein